MKRFLFYIFMLFVFGAAHAESYIVLCPENYYVDGEQCKPCGEGMASPGGNVFECTCSENYYLDGGLCKKCPKNMVSPGGSVFACTCPENYYFLTGEHSPDDMSWEVEYGEHCEKCPTGTISPAGKATECTRICPDGEYLYALYFWLDPECTPCPDGYPNSEPDKCYSDVKLREWDGTIQCAAGANGGTKSTCTICESEPEPCEYTEYSDGTVRSGCAANPCLSHIMGEHIADPGFMWNAESGKFEQCPAGTYSYVGSSTECTQCPEGTYSAAGASICTVCPVGTSSDAGASECTPCAPGTINKETFNFDLYEFTNICEQCPAGTYSAGGNTTECTQCPTGTYSNAGASECTLCPAGTYSYATGATGIDACIMTPAGSFSPAGATLSTPCPAGSISNAGASECTPCPAGTYSAGGGNTECAQCPDGTTSIAGSTKCYETLCDAGYYYDGDVCTKCPAGTYSNAGECAACPDEYPNSGSNGSSCYAVKTRECSAAPTGCETAQYEICEYTEQCNDIEYIPGEWPWDPNILDCSEKVISGCTECELISITALPGYRISGNTCEQCPAGTYSAGGNATECTPCPVGTYSGAVGATGCTTCPDGFYTDGTGSTSIKACHSGELERPWTGHQVCYALGCTDTICEPCEIKPCKYVMGYTGGEWPWEPEVEYVISGCETNDANCATPIQSVVVAPGWGAIGVQQCKICPAGSYSAGGENAVCTPCPANIHVSPDGATDITDCGRILNYLAPKATEPKQIFLNGIRNTLPSFNVQIGNDVLYANMTPVDDTTAPGMYVNYNDQSYIVTSSTRSKSAPWGEFIITTTSDTDAFSMNISAAGVFTINWGDGTIDNIVRNNTTLKTYSHTYATAGTYNIGLNGMANKYSNADTISFYIPGEWPWDPTPANYISRISGSLGRIFPTIGDGGAGNQPIFTSTFQDATNLTGEIPAELFDGIGGTPAPRMFESTFYGCSGLTGPSARVAGMPLYEWAATVENACPPLDCATYTGATGLSDYDEIPSEFK